MQGFNGPFDLKFSNDSNTRHLLFDQFAFLFFADRKRIFTEEEKETLVNVSSKLIENPKSLPGELSVSLQIQYKINKDVIGLAQLFEFRISDCNPYFMDFQIKVHDNVQAAKNVYSESGYSADFHIENNNRYLGKYIFFSGLSSQKQNLKLEIDFDSSRTIDILL